MHSLSVRRCPGVRPGQCLCLEPPEDMSVKQAYKVGGADTDREKTTNAGEYHSRRWVCLESRCYGAILNDDLDGAYQANSAANR
jgi:hypothetical protein